MGEIRRFEQSYVPEVAALWLKVFHRRRGPAGPSLQDYFREILLGNPWQDDELPSLVYLHHGKAVAFLGVVPRPMLFEGQPVRAAIVTQLMADREEYRGIAGVELLRHLFRGPQDLTYTDGATEAAYLAWTASGARAAQLYALDWTRVLRQGAHLRSRLAARPQTGVRAAGHALAPLFGLTDVMMAKFPFRAVRPPATAFPSQTAAADDMLACIREIGWRDPLQPVYEPAAFRWLLAQAATAGNRGVLRPAVVRDANGSLAGWYVYHAKRGGRSTVLQMGARNRKFDGVFEALLRDAWEQGASAVGGAALPRYLLPMSMLHSRFRYIGNGCLIHARETKILSCVLQGEAALSRLDGEWWMRFSDGDWT